MLNADALAGLRIPPSKQLALREIPFTIPTGLQKKMINIKFYNVN
jgi:hypothetical protein